MGIEPPGPMTPYHSQPVRTLLRRLSGRRYDAAHL
jgi:hypothetical protein